MARNKPPASHSRPDRKLPRSSQAISVRKNPPRQDILKGFPRRGQKHPRQRVIRESSPRVHGRDAVHAEPQSQHHRERQLSPVIVKPWWAQAGFNSEVEATAAFYDRLSSISLTRRALKEHDRRNKSSRIEKPLNKCLRFSARSQKSTRSVDRIPEQTLKQYCRQGGPDLSDLRGFIPTAIDMAKKRNDQCPTKPHKKKPNQAADIVSNDRTLTHSQSAARSQTTLVEDSSQVKIPGGQARTKNTSAYDPNLERNLALDKIFMRDAMDGDEFLPPPENLKELKSVIRKRHPSLKLSTEEWQQKFEKYSRLSRKAPSHDDIRGPILSILSDNFDFAKADATIYRDECPVRKDFPLLTNGVSWKPRFDFAAGSSYARIEGQVAEELKDYIVLFSSLQRPVAPNFFIEYKCPMTNIPEGYRQATVAAVYGARGIQGLRTVRQPPEFMEYDNNAYTITILFDGEIINFLCVYPFDPQDPEYHIGFRTQGLARFFLNEDQDQFERAVHAFRNLFDWAERKRNEIIDETKKRCQQTSNTESSQAQVTETNDLESIDGLTEAASQDTGIAHSVQSDSSQRTLRSRKRKGQTVQEPPMITRRQLRSDGKGLLATA